VVGGCLLMRHRFDLATAAEIIQSWTTSLPGSSRPHEHEHEHEE